MPTPLAEQLAARIREQGPIPFSAFMETALYETEHGYYADPSFTTGRSGDFAAAPDVGPLMGATLARPVAELAEIGGRFVEVGPGSGRLTVDVLEALEPEKRDALQVALVEPFEARHEQLADRVREATGVDPSIVESVGELASERSIVLANEVLDAFPVDVVRRSGDTVHAVHLDATDDGFERTWKTAPEPLAETAREPLDRLTAGSEYELAQGLDAFLANLAEAMDPGAAVFLDYGGDTTEIWGEGAEGTLRAFRDHQHADPLDAPGELDLTADVDFQRVRSIAGEHGLDRAAYGGQERLLMHLGLVREAHERDRLADVKRLVVPGGAGGFGERFRALVLDDGGIADELGVRVNLDDPEIWTRALEDLQGAGGIAGFGAGELV